MILQKEIANISEQLGISKTVIEKDWVIGHCLSAIYSDKKLKNSIIFKGGTCLKKCWFPDYRFSEDLDFTALEDTFVLTKEDLTSVCSHIHDKSGIKVHLHSLNPLIFKNKVVGYEAVLKYWGADHSKNELPPDPIRWHTKLKIEIILYEKLFFNPIKKEISHPYSDKIFLKEPITCYAIEEVVAEKLRALIQRSYSAPRDYYDLWYLSKNIPDLDWDDIVKGFFEKMKFKKLIFNGIEQFFNPDSEKIVEKAWKNSLSHQIRKQELPNYKVVKEDLELLLKKYFI